MFLNHDSIRPRRDWGGVPMSRRGFDRFNIWESRDLLRARKAQLQIYFFDKPKKDLIYIYSVCFEALSSNILQASSPVAVDTDAPLKAI